MRNARAVTTREQLIAQTWGYESESANNRLDVYMRRLRHKIEAHPQGRNLIRTIRGIGYSFMVTPGTIGRSAGARPPSAIAPAIAPAYVTAGYPPAWGCSSTRTCALKSYLPKTAILSAKKKAANGGACLDSLTHRVQRSSRLTTRRAPLRRPAVP